ncbi:hypothetical protein [Halomonas mongoliensis]|uniref:hypothetical protein n=1 Tax=Halomonas mongoliensis TaxID=321265 RepID=UPI00403A9A4A
MDAQQFNTIIREIRAGVEEAQLKVWLGEMTEEQRCITALQLDRYDLIPEGRGNPIEAWFSLDANKQRSICNAKGWSPFWAQSLVDTHSLQRTLDQANVPAVVEGRGDGLVNQVERVRFLAEQRDLLRLWIGQYGDHESECAARRGGNCDCGWDGVCERLREMPFSESLY